MSKNSELYGTRLEDIEVIDPQQVSIIVPIAELKETHKDHYQLFVNGMNTGILEKSQLRYLIEVIDNII